MTSNSHPARSPEFLSRLHDGELSSAERAHFESHRAHCSECRSSAADFEAALRLYRSSVPAPASPDLASRILRKLQASPTRRQRFGPTFGIDLRWAGAFAVAVIAAIVGSSIVAQNEARQRQASRMASGPVTLESAPADAPVALVPVAPQPGSAGGNAPVSALPPLGPRVEREADDREELAREEGQEKKAAPPLEAGRADLQKAHSPENRLKNERTVNGASVAEPNASKLADESASASAPASASVSSSVAAPPIQAPPQTQAQAQAQTKTQAKGQVASPSTAETRAMRPEAAAAARRQDDFVAQQTAPRDLDRAGGEGAAAADQLRPAAMAVRIVVSPLDGISYTPELVADSSADLPGSLRGQKFIVLVDASGRVLDVGPWRKAPTSSATSSAAPKPQRSAGQRQAQGQTQAQAPTPGQARSKDAESPSSSLRALRFQPGDAPRRLLIQVE